MATLPRRSSTPCPAFPAPANPAPPDGARPSCMQCVAAPTATLDAARASGNSREHWARIPGKTTNHRGHGGHRGIRRNSLVFVAEIFFDFFLVRLRVLRGEGFGF